MIMRRLSHVKLYMVQRGVSPRDAEFLARALTLSESEHKRRSNETEKETEKERIERAIEDRLRNRPLAYIIGDAPFLDYDFKVNESVLIPRSDSECVALEAIHRLEFNILPNKAANSFSSLHSPSNNIGNDPESNTRNTSRRNSDTTLNILDIGTGSGCLLLSIMKQLSRKRFSVDLARPTDSINKMDTINAVNTVNTINTENSDIIHGNVQALRSIHGVGIDKSMDALRVASDNQQRLGFCQTDGTNHTKLVTTCTFLHADMSKPGFGLSSATTIDDNIPGRDRESGNESGNESEEKTLCTLTQRPPWFDTTSFDLIISNPPYIPSAKLPNLMDDVKDYEPALALDGGDDGFQAYRWIRNRILSNDSSRSVPLLAYPHGELVLELDAGQGDVVRDIFGSIPRGNCEPHSSENKNAQTLVERSRVRDNFGKGHERGIVFGYQY